MIVGTGENHKIFVPPRVALTEADALVLTTLLTDNGNLLRTLTTIDLQIIIGYLTVQFVAGAWLLAGSFDLAAQDAWFLAIARTALFFGDILLGWLVLRLLKHNHARRVMSVAALKAAQKALGLFEVGRYLLDSPIISPGDQASKAANWYVIYRSAAIAAICILMVGAVASYTVAAIGPENVPKLWIKRS